MNRPLFSRRDFAKTVSASVAAAVSAPYLHAAQGARHNQPEPADAVRINFNENPYGPCPKALAALDACGGIAARYPDSAYFGLSDEIARKHGVKRENIALGCGSTEILCIADEAFVGPDKHLVAADPTFEAVIEYVNAAHGAAVKVPLTKDHRHDFDAMAARCTSQTGLVYVCNPNNPTGTIMTRDEVAAFVKRVPPSAIVLVDEAYFEFATDPSYATAIPLIAEHPSVIVSRTFSKVYGMAGMRLGYGVGSKETIARLRPYNLQPFNGNAAVLAAARASLADKDHIDECGRKLNATRDWMCAQLTKQGRKFIPSQANFVMIDVGRNVKPVGQAFRAKKILVGRLFPTMPNFLRVSIGTRPQMEQFMAALNEIVPVNGSASA
ncbi:MAG TPA: histidinol-phosphate transaminase [Candidatus Acidoferrales bacterium]|nr:histidinol-phosphate transaminase [Candidatus Acidoferrales bacterium]